MACMLNCTLNGVEHRKLSIPGPLIYIEMKIQSFVHPHVVPNLMKIDILMNVLVALFHVIIMNEDHKIGQHLDLFFTNSSTEGLE